MLTSKNIVKRLVIKEVVFLNAIAFLQVSMSVRPILTLSKYKKDELHLTVQQLTAVILRIAAFHIVSEW